MGRDCSLELASSYSLVFRALAPTSVLVAVGVILQQSFLYIVMYPNKCTQFAWNTPLDYP